MASSFCLKAAVSVQLYRKIKKTRLLSCQIFYLHLSWYLTWYDNGCTFTSLHSLPHTSLGCTRPSLPFCTILYQNNTMILCRDQYPQGAGTRQQSHTTPSSVLWEKQGYTFLQVCSYDECMSDLCNWLTLSCSGHCTLVHCFAQVQLDLTQCLWLHQYKCTLSSIIYDICTEIH